MNPLTLILLFVVLGYLIGRRKGKPRQYALMGIPAGFAAYVGIFVIAAQFAY